MIKLFAEELNCKDPFHIPGQDWGVTNKDSEQNNYLNNFIDTENIEDFEDFQIFENLPGKGANEVEFNKFHEVPVNVRLNVLHFLCQQKLDSESIEFINELQQLQQQKPVAEEPVEAEIKPRISDDVKKMLEPIYLGLLKPLAKISPGLDEYLAPGYYYYFPFFCDTRIYRESLDHKSFGLFLEDFDQLTFLIQNLLDLKEKNPQRDDLSKLTSALSSYGEHLKKFSSDMLFKE